MTQRQRSKRFELLAKRDINKETYVEPWPEAGLMVADSPYDPQPGIKLLRGSSHRNGRHRLRRL